MPTLLDQGLYYFITSYSITDFWIPFILIFTVLFAILQKIKLFGDQSKRFNVIIALMLALLAVIPHSVGYYPGNLDPIEIMKGALPAIIVVVLAVLMFFVLVGFWGKEFSGIVAFIAILIILFVFGAAIGYSVGAYNLWYYIYLIPIIGPALANPDVLYVVLAIIIFGLVVWFITKEPKQPGAKKFTDALDEFFKKLRPR